MSEMEIIGKLVKIREQFRRLAGIYQNARLEQNETAGQPDMAVLRRAAPILNAAMAQLGELPEKPVQDCQGSENREYAGKLLKEIGDLLQTTLIMDREARQVWMNMPAANDPIPADDIPPAGAARARAMRAYAV